MRGSLSTSILFSLAGSGGGCWCQGRPSVISVFMKFRKHSSTSAASKMTTYDDKFIKPTEINPCIVKMENGVVGSSFRRIFEIQRELKTGVSKPFKDVIWTNIGDGQAMGQPPLTYLRQVMALISYPELFNSNEFPDDIKMKARDVLKSCSGGSIGSYTDRAGIEMIRRHIANFIQRRDGITADINNVILCSSATVGIRATINLLACNINGKKPGVLIPIPQYPVYSAVLDEFDMSRIDYFLDESQNWALKISELEAAIGEARKTCNPRALVVINPGNPTGQVLLRQNMESIIKFAHREKLILFADEVYQENIYEDGLKFHSFKKVLFEMGPPYSEMELVSFNSASKGYLGECGFRGAYIEVVNFCPEVMKMLLKYLSAQLCPNVLGQAAVECMVNPPQEGEQSYPLFVKERDAIIESLKRKAEIVVKLFNSLEGVTCNPVQGAMYAFPQIKLPPKAIEAAKLAGKQPDTFYTSEVLENTGICFVDGTSFGQKAGTYHFRSTILPSVDVLETMAVRLGDFHQKFMNKYK